MEGAKVLTNAFRDAKPDQGHLDKKKPCVSECSIPFSILSKPMQKTKRYIPLPISESQHLFSSMSQDIALTTRMR